MANKKGILVVVSGPAGTGKGTVISRVFEKSDKFVYSVSATTRTPRPGEKDGIAYHFKTKEKFEELINDNLLLEYTYYCGNYYGTLKSAVDKYLNRGLNVILEIEVDGAMRIKTKFPESVLILIIPPNFQTLEKRLRKRGTNTEEDIQRRLARSREEIRFFNRYDYVIVNGNNKIDKAADTFISIIDCEEHAVKRNPEIYNKFFKD